MQALSSGGGSGQHLARLERGAAGQRRCVLTFAHAAVAHIHLLVALHIGLRDALQVVPALVRAVARGRAALAAQRALQGPKLLAQWQPAAHPEHVVLHAAAGRCLQAAVRGACAQQDYHTHQRAVISAWRNLPELQAQPSARHAQDVKKAVSGWQHQGLIRSQYRRLLQDGAGFT